MGKSLTLLMVLILAGMAGPLRAEGWRAGVGKSRITPEGPVWMAGYADRSRPADGTLCDLWARALYLEDARGERLLLVTLDLVGIHRDLSQSLAGVLAARHGLERRQVVFCTSHTHSGPVVGDNLSSLHYRMLPPEHQWRIDAYEKFLEQRILEAAASALDSRAPCELSWGNGRAAFAVNRRTNPEAEVPARRAAGQLAGPQDHDVPVLAVHSPEGALRAVVFGYACHATVLSGFQWSGDYPGFAEQTLEQDYPGCVALFWAGCGGDQNPLPRRLVPLAQQYGHELAGSVKQVLDAPRTPIRGNLVSRYDEVDLPFASLPTRAQWEEDARSDNRYAASRARGMLKQLDEGQAIPASYPYPIASVVLGDGPEWIFLGGEVVIDYAVRLKSERKGVRTWVAGYANDVMAYIPSRRVLREGGYEGSGAMVYYGLPASWSDEVEERILAAVGQQLP